MSNNSSSFPVIIFKMCFSTSNSKLGECHGVQSMHSGSKEFTWRILVPWSQYDFCSDFFVGICPLSSLIVMFVAWRFSSKTQSWFRRSGLCLEVWLKTNKLTKKMFKSNLIWGCLLSGFGNILWHFELLQW